MPTCPFDVFLEEQVAGDLLPATRIADRRRRRIATTFLVLGNNNLEERDKAQLRMDVVDERVDTIGKAFLAQTIGCARCHDHKFDPIPTRDYYALAGILRNVKALEHANVSRWLDLPLPVEPEQEALIKQHVVKREMVMSVVEEAEIGDTRVHIRGSVHDLGAPVPRGFLRVATVGAAPAIPSGESGRRELAAWLAGADNPLTARVVVNRVWHWLFGAGLVRTTDNFGTTGEAPSHPELLDDLAIRFMEDGWSVKALVRRIVLSRAYQLATARDRPAQAADPENRLLWRMNRRRLDAECIRDTILAVSGQLRDEMGGPTFPGELAADYGFQQAGTRRSVYSPVFRNALPELFEVFDFADPSMVVGRRDVSTVAPQALFLMNHPFLLEQSRQAARRLLSETGEDDRERIERAYRLALGRSPSGPERRIAREFRSRAEDAGDGASTVPEETWALLFQALFASIDFRYVD
jgi:uncharacterized protein DUF1553/uncharacterized protein DUF1549